jgi:hypothetical protein
MTDWLKKLINELPADKESWASARLWLGYTLIWSFLPVWFGILAGIGFLYKKPVNWLDFVVHGELLIYSASLLAGTHRLISREVNTGRPFVHGQWFGLASMTAMAFAAGFYAMIKVLTFLDNPVPVRVSFLLWFSIPTLIASISFAFVVFAFDHYRSRNPINVPAKAKKEQDELSDQIDQIGEGNGGR